MPIRSEPFINNNIYHVYNKTIDNKKVFKSNNYCLEFYRRLLYYKSDEAKISYSKISELSLRNQELLQLKISKLSTNMVEVLAYVFMPNHYHLLVQQIKDSGVSNYMSKSINSFTKYYNTKINRKGQLFLKDFRAVKILTDEQLIHTSRYIHLNPYSSGIVTTLKELESYSWSSYKSYLNFNKDKLINNELVLSQFENKISSYKEFMKDRSEYQKYLEEIKHYSG